MAALVAAEQEVARLQLGRWDCVAPRLGLRLAVEASGGAGGAGRLMGQRPGREPLARRLGIGVALQLLVDLGSSRLEPPAWLWQQWGRPETEIMAVAAANTLASPMSRLDQDLALPNGPSTAQLTVLSGGPFTTGMVVDLGRLIPTSLVGDGLLATTDRDGLVVLTTTTSWSHRELRQAARCLGTLIEGAGETPTSLVLFRRGGEFAIFGSNGTRRDDPFGMTDGANHSGAAPNLTVQFLGEIYRPESELIFGRDAELALDDNSYLHRQAGRFRRRAATWWLENVGSRLRLTMVGADGSLIDLQPGGSSPLLCTSGEISLTAGPTRYQIEYVLDHSQIRWDDTGPFQTVASDTMTFGPLLTPREVDFVVVLAQGRLTGRLGPLPTLNEIAEIWGVSPKTVDNTLQRLRSKIRGQHVHSVQSSENMVEYLVTQGLVTLADLEWARLDNANGPRPAATRLP
jgi:DNA-binding CsgD family transcriptional regulator